MNSLANADSIASQNRIIRLIRRSRRDPCAESIRLADGARWETLAWGRAPGAFLPL